MRHIDAKQMVDDTAVTKTVVNNGPAPLILNTGIVLGERRVVVEAGETKSVRMAKWVSDALSQLPTVKIT